ncbi:MAG: hypothetical protein QXU98_10835 [Candidatus Parvarchaeota archaeon]
MSTSGSRSSGVILFSISGVYGSNVITATMVQQNYSAMPSSEASSFLLSALQKLLGSVA